MLWFVSWWCTAVWLLGSPFLVARLCNLNPFLDCLASRNNNQLWTTMYRKPTHTDRLLDESSYNPTSHKATTIKTDEMSTTSLWHTRQLTWRKQIPWTCFSQEQLQRWLLDETFTDLLKLMLRTGTQHLLLQWLSLTLRALLRPSHGSYSPTTFV